jgi:hypothetical protein
MSPSPRRRNYHLGNQDGRSAARAGRLTPQQKAAVRKRAHSERPRVHKRSAVSAVLWLLGAAVLAVLICTGVLGGDQP